MVATIQGASRHRPSIDFNKIIIIEIIKEVERDCSLGEEEFLFFFFLA